MSKFLTGLVKKWQLILYISLMLGAMTFLVSTIIEPRYKSEITVLIVQKKADILTASKNAEYLGNVFEQVLYTESFMDGVLKTDPTIKRNFSKDAKKRKSEWNKEISVEKVGSTGMLKISVFDPTNDDSYKISLGIAKNFKENSAEYFGQKEEVETKIIDGPITSSKVAYPNILLNTVAGLLIGFFGSLVIVYFFEDFDLKLVGRAGFKRKKTEYSENSQFKKQVGEQLARQLEKRNDRVALEYLEPKDENDFLQESDSLLESGMYNEDLYKENVEDSFANSELEYIEIDEDDALEETLIDQPVQLIEEVEDVEPEEKEDAQSSPFRMIQDQVGVVSQKNDSLNVFKHEEGNDSFWQNMHAIDDMADTVEEDDEDNPLLEDYMVDMDTYEQIIKAGETYRGFKKLQEKGQVEGVKDIAKFDTKEDTKETYVEKSSKVDKEKDEKIEVVREKKALNLDKESLLKDTTSNKKDFKSELGDKDSAMELSSAGLKTLKKAKDKTIKLDTSLVEENEKENKIQKLKKEESKVSTKKGAESSNKKEVTVSEKRKVKSSTKKAKQEIEEDLEEIVEQKKASEKKEIEDLLAKEVLADKEKDQKNVLKAGAVLIDEKNKGDIDSDLASERGIESIDFIGKDEGGDILSEKLAQDEAVNNDFFVEDELDQEDFEEPKKGNIFSRLYGKSIFSDKKYKQQKEKRTTHHMEMDPEELEMMRKMLEAEGKSEEEFAMENGLVPERVDSEIKSPSLEKEDEIIRMPEAYKIEAMEPVTESVTKVELKESAVSNDKKAQSPRDLPVFIEEEDQQDAFVRQMNKKENTKKKASVKKKTTIIKKESKKVDPNKEVSENEIKERLNKLLQGEM